MYWNSENVRHVTNPHHDAPRIVRASEQFTVGQDSQSPEVGENYDGPTAEFEPAENSVDYSPLEQAFEASARSASAGAPEEVEGNYGMMFTRWPDEDGRGGYIMCHDCGTEKYFFGDMFDIWVDGHSTPGPGGCPTLAQNQYDLVAFRKGAPFADYEDFADCQNKNRGKVDDTGAYCGEIQRRTEDKESSLHVGGVRIDRAVTLLDRLGLSLWAEDGPYTNSVWAIDPVDQMYVPVLVKKKDDQVGAQIVAPVRRTFDQSTDEVRDLMKEPVGYDEWYHRRVNRGAPTTITMDASEVGKELDYLQAANRTASLDSAGIMDRVVAANSEFEGAEADIRAGVPFVLVRADSDSGTGWKMTVVVEEAVQVPSGGVATDYENAKIVHMDMKDGRYSPAETAERWLRSKFNYSPDVRIVYVNGTESVPRLSHAGYQSSNWRDYPTDRRHTAAVKTAMNWWDAIEDPRHVVAGWSWDDHLSGYVAEGMLDFACACGAHVAAPGHVACTCGKVWNSYPIVANGVTRLVAREVPVRDGVVLANRRTAAGQRYVRDEEYWGLPEGTPIKPGQKPQGDSGSSSKPDPEPVREPEPTPEPEPAPEPAPAPKPEKPKLPPLTEEQIQQRVEEVQTKVDKALEDGFETQLYYQGTGGRGTYTADRRRQQRHLISKFWADRGADHIPREGKAIMSGGLGGSGKTTILKSEGVGIDQSQYLTINADDIKEMMVDEGMIPEIEGCAPMELAALIHEESSDISQAIALEAYRDGINVIWDLTMGSTGSIEKRLAHMREAGYNQIDAVFVDIPVEKSVERAISRYKNGLEKYRNGKGDGGRYVPPDVIRRNKPSEGSQFNSKNREVFEKLKDQFDNAVVYDNSGGPGEQKKMTGFGRWAHVQYPSYTIPDWAIY